MPFGKLISNADSILIYTLHFQGFFVKDPKGLLTTKDSRENTVAHLVAASGNTDVFEVYYV